MNWNYALVSEPGFQNWHSVVGNLSKICLIYWNWIPWFTQMIHRISTRLFVDLHDMSCRYSPSLFVLQTHRVSPFFFDKLKYCLAKYGARASTCFGNWLTFVSDVAWQLSDRTLTCVPNSLPFCFVLHCVFRHVCLNKKQSSEHIYFLSRAAASLSYDVEDPRSQNKG